jgi:hypothetical protein
VRNVGEPAGSVVNLALRAAMIVALELSLRNRARFMSSSAFD